jgi:hypothetical protein
MMRFSRLIVFSLFFLLAITACSSAKRVGVTAEDHFSSPYIAFHAPDANWYVYDSEWHINESKTSYSKKIFNNQASNGSSSIEVSSFTKVASYFFEADHDYVKHFEAYQNSAEQIELRREQGIDFYKAEVLYFQGMRCTNSAFSRSYGGSAYSASSKNYTLACGYYHKSEGRRMLLISYRYYGASDASTHLVKSGDALQPSSKPISDAEIRLKSDLLQVLATIELKDVDWQRMQDEGLIHDKPFVNTRW